jgi:iron transport multicopper oxidase
MGPLAHTPFVDPNDPQKSLYDVDDASTIIQLGDWYHTPAKALTTTYLAAGGSGDEPVPDSGTINGKGRFVGGPATTRTVINVTQGKRYRMRLINISAFGQFRFSIEGHSLTIIEVDGIAHKPLVVDQLDILAGQRYSVIVSYTLTVN